MKLIDIAATALIALSPAIVMPQTVNADSTSKGTITVGKEEAMITKGGNFIRKSWNNPDTDGWHIKAGVVQTIPGKTLNFNGQPMMFQGREYLNIGNGGYVNAFDIAKLNGNNTSMLGSNAYVYNSKGKRIKKFLGQSKLLKNHIVERAVSDKEGKGKYYYTTLDGISYTVPSKMIKGKSYFSLGNGGLRQER